MKGSLGRNPQFHDRPATNIYITKERPGRGSEGQTVKGKRASDRKLPLRLRILKGGGLAASLLEVGRTLRENMAGELRELM